MSYFFEELIKNKTPPKKAFTLTAEEHDLLFNQGGMADLLGLAELADVYTPSQAVHYQKARDDFYDRIYHAPIVEEPSISSEEHSEEELEFKPFVSYQAADEKLKGYLEEVPLMTLRNENLSTILPGKNTDLVAFFNGSCQVPKTAKYILTEDKYIQVNTEVPVISDPERTMTMLIPVPDETDRLIAGLDGAEKIKNISVVTDILEALEKEYPKYRSSFPDYMYHLKDTVSRLPRDDVEKFYRDCALRLIFAQMPNKTRVGVITKSEFDFRRICALDGRLVFVQSVVWESVDVVLVDPYGRALEDEGLDTDYLHTRAAYDISKRALMWEGCVQWIYAVNNLRPPDNMVAYDEVKCFSIAPHRPRFFVTNVAMPYSAGTISFSASGNARLNKALFQRLKRAVSAMVAGSAMRNLALTPVRNLRVVNYWTFRIKDWTIDAVLETLVPGTVDQPIHFDLYRKLKCHAMHYMKSAQIMQMYAAMGGGMLAEEAFYERKIRREDLRGMVLQGHLAVACSQKRTFYYAPNVYSYQEYECDVVENPVIDLDGVHSSHSLMFKTPIIVPHSIKDLVYQYASRVVVGTGNVIYSHADRANVRLKKNLPVVPGIDSGGDNIDHAAWAEFDALLRADEVT